MQEMSINYIRLFKTFFRSCGIAIMLVYLGFHLLHEDQGLVGRIIQDHKQQHLQQELEATHRHRMELERNVALMKSDTIDPDLLDELARRQLPVVGDRQIIMLK